MNEHLLPLTPSEIILGYALLIIITLVVAENGRVLERQNPRIIPKHRNTRWVRRLTAYLRKLQQKKLDSIFLAIEVIFLTLLVLSLMYLGYILTFVIPLP